HPGNATTNGRPPPMREVEGGWTIGWQMRQIGTSEQPRGASPHPRRQDDEIRLGWRLPLMTIRAVVESHGHFAHGGNPEDTAETWAESGFEAHEVDEWLNARCFDPTAARDLADAEVSAADAR